MVHTIRLKINGTETDLPWSEFVANIDSTVTSIKLFEYFDTAFVVQCSTLLFLMQAGFILMETGSLSTRRRVNALLLKNLGDTVLCAFFYFLIGYAFSHGDGGPFIGESGFFGVGEPLCNERGKCSSKEYSLMFFRFLKTATSVTILSGCIAERVPLWVYFLLVSVSSSFSLPLLSRWTNHPDGWASPYVHSGSFFRTGVLDFAGVGEVSVAGAMPALILLPLIGPRHNRFLGDCKTERLPGQNNYFKSLGTTIMWMSWYGLVCGGVSTLRVNGGAVVAKIAVNTTVSAVAASIVAVSAGLYYERKLCPTDASNGILSGLVGITGACATVETEWALFIGLVAGLIYFSLTKVFLTLQIDDVVDGVPIHLCCGLWSVIAPALFSTRQLVKVAYPEFADDSSVPCGLLYQCDGLGSVQLGANLVYCVFVILWVGLTSSLIILPLWYFRLIRYTTRTGGEDSDTPVDYTGDDDSLLSDGTEVLIQGGNADKDGVQLDEVSIQNILVSDEVAGGLLEGQKSQEEKEESSEPFQHMEQTHTARKKEESSEPVQQTEEAHIARKKESSESVQRTEKSHTARKDSLLSDSDPLGDFNMIQSAYPDIEEEDIMTPKTEGARSQSSPSSPISGSMKSGEFNIELEDR